MRKYDPEKLRNVALIAHGGTGKTSLVEAMLYVSGVTDRLGSIEAGNTISDSDPDEIERQVSLSCSLLSLEWKGHKVNLFDCPGYPDFLGEVIFGLQVADAVVVLVDGAEGVGIQTERYWQMAKEQGLPGAVVINKMDKENADFDRQVTALSGRLGCRPVVTHIPIMKPFRGVVDVLSGKAYLTENQKESVGEAPPEMADSISSWKEKLIEEAAEADDSLTEKYLEEGILTEEEVQRGLRARIERGEVTPVLPAAAVQATGASALLDCIISWLPSPLAGKEIKAKDSRKDAEVTLAPKAEGPLAAFVFKTTADPFAGRFTAFRVFSGSLHSDSQVYNSTRRSKERVGQIFIPRGKNQEAVSAVSAGDCGVVAKLRETLTGDTLTEEPNSILLPAPEIPEPVYSLAIAPLSKGDEDKVGSALGRLTEEDPTLCFSADSDTRETILSGTGDLHLEVNIARLKRKFGVEVSTGAPKVAYRETVRATAKAQGKYKKQTGGRGQYGDVWLEVEPLERGAGFEFADRIVGGVVPKNYIPSVEKGIRESLGRGIIAGYPVTDLRVTLYDGSFHPVDSSDIAFKIAGSMGFRNAAKEAGVILLEPYMNAEVVVPEENMGEIMGHLNGRRGRIQGMEPIDGQQVIRAQVPLAEMLSYSTDLRSMTAGRGFYTMKLSHYEEVPAHIAEKIIEKARKEEEEGR
ncbi:MAG: elongation factor G [Armatimonadetes bacterium]|nr:elongation factor G [Armatimonadota bacterium]NIM24262.1 elongation factor G [Armatimonadota bacterium]NIM68131.1 elongation factor G [Armatimonadota bacterium]NIM76593.1 elongation factor G [Armatimonadota bacterium]NIN06336.1 elongation factor G [Armatimonadota bacterium]